MPRVNCAPSPDIRLLNGLWVAPARRRQSFKGVDEFIFLNKIGCISELGWNGPERERLWRYNQHYFDDLNAKDSDERYGLHCALIERWVDENEPGNGTGWEPYPTSLRIVNWVKWQLEFNRLEGKCLHSLAIQARWLNQLIEWHILGNHLFANAKALVFAGLFFKGFEANKWLYKGLRIIKGQIEEQVLSDGAHFELSPMYHTIFLEDILDLINISGVYVGAIDESVVAEWRETAKIMIVWLESMSHPDGEISFFNDSAFGVAPTLKEIKAYAGRLSVNDFPEVKIEKKLGLNIFSDSGYIRLTSNNSVILLDVAPVGASYLPGHAHADTLSFELSLFSERFLVNSGTSEYGNGPIRLEERGTKSHNTVLVDNCNSSEVWSGFRVARRASLTQLQVEEDGDSLSVLAVHDGYIRLPGRVLHKRSWRLFEGRLVVQDLLLGDYKQAVSRFHFHPGVKIIDLTSNLCTIILPVTGQEVQLLITGGEARIEPYFFAPEFGIRIKSQCLAVYFEASDIAVDISWSTNG